MKRLHVHLKVGNLDDSIAFYTALFGRAPDKIESDYAKWLLDDPRANVSISTRPGQGGVDHVGVQLDNDGDLEEIAARLTAADASIAPESNATCCYAKSNKYWARSPEGAVWELFHTFGDSATYGADPKAVTAPAQTAACCAPAQ
ncbi:MAG: ArsI/CadI family heavy metal resistance metalloenzyme [Pseudomonadota bacterium]|nr:ArsI/CadI family heavy metal resistance metalloenzyme [Pseudomonadota bacterium]